MASADAILGFWFGSESDDLTVIKQRGPTWFSSDPELDESIRERFAADVARAASGELDDWTVSARGRLAVVILLDQFTRNIYRGTAQAFASDDLALQHCRAGIESGQDRELRPVERTFLYMPLMHSEAIAAQDQAVQLFEGLIRDTEGELKKSFENNLKFAHMHRELIERFGRFPHRNAILGRENTPAETEHLSGDAETFGQSTR